MNIDTLAVFNPNGPADRTLTTPGNLLAGQHDQLGKVLVGYCVERQWGGMYVFDLAPAPMWKTWQPIALTDFITALMDEPMQFDQAALTRWLNSVAIPMPAGLAN